MKIKTDVLIVGTGFCGYAAYKNLSGLGQKIVVMEGGGIPNPENADDQQYYKVRQNKFANKKFNLLNNLDLSYKDRRYTLGGSSEAWSGFIVPLGSHVYRQKFDDWPLEWGDINLSRYDARSLELINSPLKYFSEDVIPDDIKRTLPELPSGFRYSFWAFAPQPLRLKDFWLPLVANSPQNLNSDHPVICNHKLKDFIVDKYSQNIKEFVFESSDNQTLIVEANKFILACGGVENAYLAKKIDKTIQNSYPRKIKSKTINASTVFVEHPHLYNYAYIKLAPGASCLKQCPLKLTCLKPKFVELVKDFSNYIEAGGEGGVPGMSFEFVPVNESNNIRKVGQYYKIAFSGECI